MSLELPPTFTLDANGELLKNLEDDTLATILNVQSAYIDTQFSRLIINALDLLIPDSNNIDSIYKSYAFTSSAFIIAAAFNEASAGEVDRNRALKALALRNVSQGMLSKNPADRLSSFTKFAIRAHRQHPEMRSATNLLLEYHVETTQDPSMSCYALSGSGFMIQQLDDAWTRTYTIDRERAIDAAYEVEIAAIDPNDWDIFFK